MPGQIEALPGDGRSSSRGLGFKAPRIVMTCRLGFSRRSAWASTSATASLNVSATATHLQEHDTAHGAAKLPEMSLYARVRGTRRRWATRTRRRSRRPVSRATACRSARTIRLIMLARQSAHRVPATHSVLWLELSGPRHFCAEHGRSHHGLCGDISREGEP
jgi:hypothetical protein